MASAVYKFAKCLDGAPIPELLTGTAGGAITAGAPLVFSSGSLVEATGGADTGAVVGVATAAAASSATVTFVPTLPNVLFRTSDVSAAITRGVKYGLTATTLTVAQGDTTNVRLKCIEGANAEGEYGIVFLGWLA